MFFAYPEPLSFLSTLMTEHMNSEQESSRVAIEPMYIPFFQKDYCCVPACIQMILYRRNLPLFPQGTIGKAMGLVIPKDYAEAFYEDIKTSRSKKLKTYGAHSIVKTLNSFFRRKKIDLRSQYISPDTIGDITGFVRKNILQGNDIMVSYANHALESIRCAKNNRTSHCVLIQELDGDQVTCVDPYPDNPELWETRLHHLVDSMPLSNNGFRVFCSTGIQSRQMLQTILKATKK
ncbi:hypothetical protein HYZ98_02215 [Candidatus Peregrinibacteria bacterium]|nr:hypothetical protein [Candidatus Peregrinibacteria bacterium]